ncbi:MAG: glycosyltransferase family 4 protein [Desulfobulbaceae bacterium]|nr:glycosyltransferase family 4 protein [Desulfobulbaceae bacterium]
MNSSKFASFRLAILNSHPIQYFGPLYRRLAQEPGIDLTVYYCSRQGVDEYADPGFGRQFKWDTPILDGYNYKFLPNLRRQDRVDGLTSLVNPAIVREIFRNRYDAIWVHGHSYITYLLAIGAAKLSDTPVLMRCETHLLLNRHPMKRFVRRGIMTAFYHLCDICLPIGTRNAEFYRYHGVSDDKLFLVPYSVDNGYFINTVAKCRSLAQSTMEELRINPDMPIILYASKLASRKRPMDLLRAYHCISTQGIEASLIFVGSGEEEAALQEYCAKYNLTRVYFLGFQNQTMLPKYYAIADVFVIPSENEPWGLIINEVMCSGLPIVATDEIGAVKDIVHHNDNGLLFRAGDIQTLSRHLAYLCLNREIRNKMGGRSLEIIQTWGYEQCVTGIVSALLNLSNARG